MIHLHCTKKLIEKLPVDATGRLQSSNPLCNAAANDKCIKPSPLSGWHAHLVTLQRRNCVLFVHDATRFPALAICLNKPDFADLDWHFQHALMNTLLKLDARQDQLDAAAAALTPLVCDTHCDRSVQGTMNQMKQDLEHMLWYDSTNISDLDPCRTGAWLAHRPCGVNKGKSYVWPDKEMLALLGRLAIDARR